MCAHVCRCFWVVALVCMLCVVGMCLWVCFGSACVSGACMRVGLYSVCGEAPVRRFSGTQLPVSQLFRTESFPRPLLPPHFPTEASQSPPALSAGVCIPEAGAEAQSGMSLPSHTRLLSSPHRSAVAVAAAVSGCSGGFLCNHCVCSCASVVVWLDVHATCVCQSLWTARAVWSFFMCFCF